MLLAALAAAWLAWLFTLPPRPVSWTIVLSGLPLFVLGSWLLHRQADDRWRVFVGRTADWHALAAVLLVAFGIQFEDAHGVTTDGVIYFSQLRSVIFDGDLNVAEEFAFLGQPPRPYHVVPIGPTFVWLPLYVVVAVVDGIGRAIGMWSAPAESAGLGLTLPYIRAALVSSFLIGAAGLLVLHRYLREEFARGVSLATTVLVFGATPLVWYMVYEPSMTHAVSFGFVAFFVVSAARWTAVDISARRAVLLGALLGAAFLSRPQEAVFAVLPGVLLLTATAPLAVRLAAAARFAMWGLAGALPFIVVQAAHSAILFTRERFSLLGNEGYLDPLDSRWADTLWSSWHGFFSWSPVAYVAAVGTVAYLGRRPRWAVAALLIVFAMAWVNGSAADWAAGWSFGGRRFTSCLAILAPGLALVIVHLARRPMIPIGLVAVAAIVWNQLLVRQYADGRLRPHEPVPFGQIVRQQAALVTRAPFFYPFAFPANAWFAWRTGLPIDAYDLLSPVELRSTVDIVFDAAATPLLVAGWGPRAADEWGELRWMEDTRAEIVVPLARESDAAVTFEIQWRTRLLDPPVTTPVAISANGVDVGTDRPGPNAPTITSFVESAASRRWKHGFNRVVLERPDGTPPVAVYRVRVR